MTAPRPAKPGRICTTDAEIIAAAQADGDRLDNDPPPGLPNKLAAIITAAATTQHPGSRGAA